MPPETVITQTRSLTPRYRPVGGEAMSPAVSDLFDGRTADTLFYSNHGPTMRRFELRASDRQRDRLTNRSTA